MAGINDYNEQQIIDALASMVSFDADKIATDETWRPILEGKVKEGKLDKEKYDSLTNPALAKEKLLQSIKEKGLGAALQELKDLYIDSAGSGSSLILHSVLGETAYNNHLNLFGQMQNRLNEIEGEKNKTAPSAPVALVEVEEKKPEVVEKKVPPRPASKPETATTAHENKPQGKPAMAPKKTTNKKSQAGPAPSDDEGFDWDAIGDKIGNHPGIFGGIIGLGGYLISGMFGNKVDFGTAALLGIGGVVLGCLTSMFLGDESKAPKHHRQQQGCDDYMVAEAQHPRYLPTPPHGTVRVNINGGCPTDFLGGGSRGGNRHGCG